MLMLAAVMVAVVTVDAVQQAQAAAKLLHQLVLHLHVVDANLLHQLVLHLHVVDVNLLHLHVAVATHVVKVKVAVVATDVTKVVDANLLVAPLPVLHLHVEHLVVLHLVDAQLVAQPQLAL